MEFLILNKLLCMKYLKIMYRCIELLLILLMKVYFECIVDLDVLYD